MKEVDLKMEIQMKTLKKSLDHRKSPSKLLTLLRNQRSKIV